MSKRTEPVRSGSCKACNQDIYRRPGISRPIYTCDCHRWLTKASLKPVRRSTVGVNGNSFDEIRKKYAPLITEVVEDGMNIASVLVYTKKRYGQKHNLVNALASRETSKLRLNDVANILRSVGYTFDGMDRPFVQWTPKGTEIVRKEV